MMKYMKYEIKGTYKFILGILAIVIIASTIIQFSVLGELNNFDSPNSSNMITGFQSLLFIASILTISGAFLTAIFYIIGSFRKELYENRGYLTFTLPLTGNQILGAKLLVSMIWYGVLALGITIYNIMLIMILYDNSWIEMLREMFSLISVNFISLGIVSIISIILTLMLIYFSIALSRVSIRNRKIGGIWFIIFIVLNSFVTFLGNQVGKIFPYYLNLENLEISNFYDLNIVPNMGNEFGSLILMGSNLDSYINIFAQLIIILIIVGTFLATGYLIEKKIDL